MSGDCGDCLHQDLKRAEEPCNSCSAAQRPWSNWKSIKMANIPNADGSAVQNMDAKQAAYVAGRKDDGGKLDMTLLDDMPRAIKALVEVMQWAVTKKQPVPYERGSWQNVAADRYRAAQVRHNVAQGEQFTADPMNAAEPRFQRDYETGLLHEAHKACSAMMALENILRELENT